MRKKLAALLLAGCLIMENAGAVMAAGIENVMDSQEMEMVSEEKDETETSDEDMEIPAEIKEADTQDTDTSDKLGEQTEVQKAEISSVVENSLEEVYVSAAGNDDTGTGTQENPVATLEKAVQAAGNKATVYVMSDLVLASSARYYGKHLTITSGEGGPYTLTRGRNFEQIQDAARSTYNPAMIEVDSTAGPDTASLTLTNITLDDMGIREGEYFIQADSEGDGKTDFGNLTGDKAIVNTSIAQDAMIATYNGVGTIILGDDAVLKNFGGMSAVRMSGGTLIMKSGSRIFDDSVADREKGTVIPGAEKGLYGPAGAIWLQGGTLIMEQGAEISNVVGRAVYEDSGYAEINGILKDLKADSDMWQGRSGVAIHTRNDGRAVLGATGVIDTVTSDTHAGYTGAVMTNGDRNEGENAGEDYDFEARPGSVIRNVTGFPVLFSNYGNELLNGTIEKCTNDYIIGGFAQVTTVGESGVLQNNTCTKGDARAVVYTSNASDVYMNGMMKDNDASYGFYIINQSGGGAHLEINEGALIQGIGKNTGVYVNASESSCTMNGGTVTGFGTGVNCRGKKNRDATFIMNGGKITDNTLYAINFSNFATSESVVELNAGSIENNGMSAQISVMGGNSNDICEHIKVKAGILKGSQTVQVTAGTITLDDDYPDVQLGNAKKEAVDKIKELVKDEHADWTVCGYSALWVRPSTETFHYTISKSSGVKKTGLFVAYIPLKADGTPADEAELVMKEVANTDLVDVTLDALDPGTSYAVMFVNNTEYTLAPDDVTKYIGGGQGDEDYDDGFPILSISDSIDLNYQGRLNSLTVNGEERTATEDKTLLDQLLELLEVTYYDEAGNIVASDVKPGGYEAKLSLKDGYAPVDIRVNGNEINLNGTGTLIIRYISDIEGAESGKITYDLLKEEPNAPVDHVEAVAKKGGSDGTREPMFYLNDNEDHDFKNTGGVQLLNDALLLNEGDGRQELLEQKAVEYLGAPAQGQVYCYKFHYLDLVDAYNGNVWVTAQYGTTVYLPYPEGVTADTAESLGVKIVHYKDLHREYGIAGQADVEEAVEACELETMAAEFTPNGIMFDVPRSGFSPFAIVWQTEAHIIQASAGAGGTIDPSGIITIAEGTDETFIMLPDDGYEIDQIKIDSQVTDMKDIVDEKGIGHYIFENITEDHTIEVTFKEKSVVPGGENPDSSDGKETDSADKSPDTGDNAGIMIYRALVGAAVLAAAGCLRYRRKRK